MTSNEPTIGKRRKSPLSEVHSEIKVEAAQKVRSIQPLGDRVLVELRRDAQKVGLIYLPDGGQSLDIVCSQVIALGPEVKAKRWELAPGDYVLHVRVVGVQYDGIMGMLGGRESSRKDASHRFLKECEILAVVDPEHVGKITGQAFYDEGKLGMKDTRSL